MIFQYADPDSGNTSFTWSTGNPIAVQKYMRINGGGDSVSEDIFTRTISDVNDAFELARPSSAHIDGVNAAMADGGTRYITDSIDYRTYQALLTLRGKSSNVPWPENTLVAENL